MERKNSKENDWRKSWLFLIIRLKVLLKTVEGSFNRVTELPFPIRSNVQIIDLHA